MTSQREPFTCLYRGIWNDEKFWLRSELGQRVYLYLISSPLGNGLGCFRAGMAAMAEDLRMLPSRFAEGFAEGYDERLGEPLFNYDEGTRVVFIPKYLERNPPSNPNGIRALSKAFVSIPDCKLKLDCYHTVKAFVKTKNATTKKGGETFAQAFAEAFTEPSLNHAANVQRTMPLCFDESPGTSTVPVPLPIPLAVPDTYTRSACRAPCAPAHVISNLEDPRGYESEWEWENLPDELTDQLSANLSDVSHGLAVRLLWYWPHAGQQWAEETAVQTLKLYVDKGLDVNLSLAQAAGKYHRNDAELHALRGQLASWMANDLNKMKRATGHGGPGLASAPEPETWLQRETRIAQAEWDAKVKKKASDEETKDN